MPGLAPCKHCSLSRSFLPHSELDLLRAQMMEEAEGPHRAKCERLEKVGGAVGAYEGGKVAGF